MNEIQRVERNRTMLQQCYPVFRTNVATLIIEMQSFGFLPRIQCAWRSVEDQLEAFRTGNSHVKFGFHNVTGVAGLPEALAVDILDNDHPLNPTRAYLIALTRIAWKHNLRTGIDWDLPQNIKVALNASLHTTEIWSGKIGFDPCHVETTDVSIEQARIGLRPKSVRPMNV